jgi:hypothetical protein
MQTRHGERYPPYSSTNDGKVWVVFFIRLFIKKGVVYRINQPGAFTVQACIEMPLRTNGRCPFALRFFKLIQLPLITKPYFLAESLTFLAATLTFWTNSPEILFMFHLFDLPFI